MDLALKRDRKEGEVEYFPYMVNAVYENLEKYAAKLAKCRYVFIEHQLKSEKCIGMQGMLAMCVKCFSPEALIILIYPSLKAKYLFKYEGKDIKAKAIAAAYRICNRYEDEETLDMLNSGAKMDDVADTVVYGYIISKKIME